MPCSVACSADTLYVCDSSAHVIRAIDKRTGAQGGCITSIARERGKINALRALQECQGAAFFAELDRQSQAPYRHLPVDGITKLGACNAQGTDGHRVHGEGHFFRIQGQPEDLQVGVAFMPPGVLR